MVKENTRDSINRLLTADLCLKKHKLTVGSYRAGIHCQTNGPVVAFV